MRKLGPRSSPRAPGDSARARHGGARGGLGDKGSATFHCSTRDTRHSTPKCPVQGPRQPSVRVPGADDVETRGVEAGPSAFHGGVHPHEHILRPHRSLRHHVPAPPPEGAHVAARVSGTRQSASPAGPGPPGQDHRPSSPLGSLPSPGDTGAAPRPLAPITTSPRPSRGGRGKDLPGAQPR